MEVSASSDLVGSNDASFEKRGRGTRFKLAILATHPIQYYAPWFRYLGDRLDIEVLYMHQQDSAGQSAAGFGVDFEWDVPLLDGYRYRWLKNVSTRPRLQSFWGCDTPELFDLIKPQKYDALLVLGWNKKSFVQGIRAAWHNKVPILSRGDSQLSTQRTFLKRTLKFAVYRWLLPRIDAHLYVGKRNREYLKHYGVREEQLFFSPHFVDNDFFAKEAEAARDSGRAQQAREQLGIPASAIVALYTGKFLANKRPADFVRAAAKAVEKRKDFHAMLVGDGPLRTELENLSSSMRSRIHFTGFRNQSELPTYYAASDVLVLPGDETWGLVVNEAMASDIPAIVSEACGCAEDMIDTGQTGWSFPTGDVDALTKLLVDFQTIDRTALRGKCAEFSMEKATRGLLQALNAKLPT